MKFTTLIALLFFSLSAWTKHPVHVSIVNLTFNDDGQHVEYSVRLFQDDLSVLMGIYMHEALHNNTQVDSNAISKYIQANFALSVENKVIKPELIKEEIDDVEYWLYFKAVLPENTKIISINNSILTELFEEQQNLVIISYKNKEKGLTFGLKQQKQLLHLETI